MEVYGSVPASKPTHLTPLELNQPSDCVSFKSNTVKQSSQMIQDERALHKDYGEEDSDYYFINERSRPTEGNVVVNVFEGKLTDKTPCGQSQNVALHFLHKESSLQNG